MVDLKKTFVIVAVDVLWICYIFHIICICTVLRCYNVENVQ